MKRREAIRNLVLMGGAISFLTPFGLISQACNRSSNKSEGLFNDDQKKVVEEIADTIIPATDVPGAKQAGVGPFIIMMIHDCYPKDIQATFIEGVNEVKKRATSKFDQAFVAMDAVERKALLEEFKGAEDGKEKEFFLLIRELTFLGYFTSEIGATKALTYIEVPGKYNGCVPLKKGQKAWAT